MGLTIKYYTYMLVDPRDGQPFYVGKGCGDRIKHHERDAKKAASTISAKEQRIRDIWAAGLQVKRVIVARYESEAAAYMAERVLIRQIGMDDLTNISPGSDPEPMKARRAAMAFIVSMCAKLHGLSAAKRKFAESLIAEMHEAICVADRELNASLA
jgi:hypothetical protein